MKGREEYLPFTQLRDARSPPPEGVGEDGHVVQRRLRHGNATPVRFTPPATGGLRRKRGASAAPTSIQSIKSIVTP